MGISTTMSWIFLGSEFDGFPDTECKHDILDASRLPGDDRGERLSSQQDIVRSADPTLYIKADLCPPLHNPHQLEQSHEQPKRKNLTQNKRDNPQIAIFILDF
jgi:hypothetical protein